MWSLYPPEANRESHDNFKRALISPLVTCFSFSFLTWPWYFFKRSWFLSLLSLPCSMLWGHAACHRIAKRRDPPQKIILHFSVTPQCCRYFSVSDKWTMKWWGDHGDQMKEANEARTSTHGFSSLISGPWNDPYMMAKIRLMKEKSTRVWKINSRPRILLVRK